MNALVVISWGQSVLTRRCFESILLKSQEDFALYWVQNEWDKKERKEFTDIENKLLGRFGDVTLVRNSRNEGFTRAVNQGVQRALEGNHEWITLLNNDTEVVPRWHRRLVAHAPEGCGAVAPLADVIDTPQCARVTKDWPHGVRWERGDNYERYDQRLPNASPKWFRQRKVLSYCCVAIPAKVWEDVGLLDERFGKAYGEDNDHSHRIALKGHKIGIATAVCIHHHKAGTSKSLKKDPQIRIGAHQIKIFRHKWGPGHPPEGYPPNPKLKPWLPYND